jgi:flagellar biosynthesis protein FlhF
MGLIKQEFGSDAVILSTRDYRKGGARVHEVVAGVEHSATSADSASASGSGCPGGWEDWHKDWMHIKEHIYSLMRPSIQWERLAPRQRVALEYMQREGVHDQIIVDLYNRLAGNPNVSVLETLGERVRVKPWPRGEWKEKIHIISGPFGAGKTTTLIRMALAFRQERPEAKVAVVNTDCSRGTGRVVLRHWAELSDFTYLEARDAAGMRKALKQVSGADIIYVDTPGMDRNKSMTAHLEMFGLAGLGAAQHIVLPPHYGEAQMAEMVRRYRCEISASIIWSKLDEATSFAGIVNVAGITGLPVSCLSYGAGLSGTLSAAADTVLWRLLFKHQLPGHGAVNGEAANNEV